jgi:hypothetical protein
MSNNNNHNNNQNISLSTSQINSLTSSPIKSSIK